MDDILKTLISQGGFAAVMLAAVISYLLRKEIAFAQERKDFNALLEVRNGEIQAVIKDTVASKVKIELLLDEAKHEHADILARLDDLKNRLGKQVA